MNVTFAAAGGGGADGEQPVPAANPARAKMEHWTREDGMKRRRSTIHPYDSWPMWTVE
jgi:hypothetical protein